MPTEREKMLAGELYFAGDPELLKLREEAEALSRVLNAVRITDQSARQALQARLFGRCGANVWVQPPFYCDYGCHIEVGDNTYFNWGAVVLDCARVRVGSFVKFGPQVQVYAATHPVDPAVRKSGLEYARPVTVGDNVWVGGGTLILPGVEIGDDSVIGAGSVVTKSIPAGVVAVGNPCRVLRRVTD
jgi:maltose O-acetyltransferase